MTHKKRGILLSPTEWSRYQQWLAAKAVKSTIDATPEEPEQRQIYMSDAEIQQYKTWLAAKATEPEIEFIDEPGETDEEETSDEYGGWRFSLTDPFWLGLGIILLLGIAIEIWPIAY